MKQPSLGTFAQANQGVISRRQSQHYTGDIAASLLQKMDKCVKERDDNELGLEMILLNPMMLGSHEATSPCK